MPLESIQNDCLYYSYDGSNLSDERARGQKRQDPNHGYLQVGRAIDRN